MTRGGIALDVPDNLPHQELCIALGMVLFALRFLNFEHSTAHFDLKLSNVLKVANKNMLMDLDAAGFIAVPEPPLERKPGNLCYALASIGFKVVATLLH